MPAAGLGERRAPAVIVIIGAQDVNETILETVFS